MEPVLSKSTPIGLHGIMTLQTAGTLEILRNGWGGLYDNSIIGEGTV